MTVSPSGTVGALAVLPADHLGDLHVGQQPRAGLGQDRVGADLAARRRSRPLPSLQPASASATRQVPARARSRSDRTTISHGWHSNAMDVNAASAQPDSDEHDEHGQSRERQPPRHHGRPAVPGVDEVVEEGEDQNDHVADRMRPGRPPGADLRVARESQSRQTGRQAPENDARRAAARRRTLPTSGCEVRQ